MPHRERTSSNSNKTREVKYERVERMHIDGMGQVNHRDVRVDEGGEDPFLNFRDKRPAEITPGEPAGLVPHHPHLRDDGTYSDTSSLASSEHTVSRQSSVLAPAVDSNVGVQRITTVRSEFGNVPEVNYQRAEKITEIERARDIERVREIERARGPEYVDVVVDKRVEKIIPQRTTTEVISAVDLGPSEYYTDRSSLASSDASYTRGTTMGSHYSDSIDSGMGRGGPYEYQRTEIVTSGRGPTIGGAQRTVVIPAGAHSQIHEQTDIIRHGSGPHSETHVIQGTAFYFTKLSLRKDYHMVTFERSACHHFRKCQLGKRSYRLHRYGG